MKRFAENSQPVYMILGMNDDVLSPSYTEQIMKITKIWKIDGGHSFSGNQQFHLVFKEAVTEICDL